MKLISYFSEFMVNTVNLNQTRLDQLDARVRAIVMYLSSDSVLGPKYRNHIPQGSWAHQTIIKPLSNDEFDADFLLLLEEESAWTDNPQELLRQVRAAFKRSTTYRGMVRRKNRCVRIGYANDCHVDVVPHLVLADGRQVIVNYADNKFEDTNPEGFTDWMKEKDDLTLGNLRRVIRLLKYLRDFKNTFSCPSVILTTFLGERVQVFDAATRYADLPTSLLCVLSDLDAWLQLYPAMPMIEDPSCPGTTFNHRWDQDQYANFRSRINIYAEWVTQAYYENDDEAKSLVLWQKVFGPDFKKPPLDRSLAIIESTTSRALQRRAPLEEFIEERGFQRIGGYKARIEGTVDKKAGFRHGSLRSLRKVVKGRSLRFRLVTDVPKPFDVYWKVRNIGAEAESQNGLRGQLLKDDGSLSRTESTVYRGRHYIEAYVVKNGRVLATDHHDVVIE